MALEKRGQVWETFIPWMIALAVLVLVGFAIYLLREQLGELAIRFKNLFRSNG